MGVPKVSNSFEAASGIDVVLLQSYLKCRSNQRAAFPGPWHRDRRKRDAAGSLQPARAAAHRLALSAFSFNVPSVRASGAITIERGAGKTVRQTFTRTGGMCPRCEGRGTVSDIDLTQLFDDSSRCEIHNSTAMLEVCWD